jgi:hypothetical protein
VARHRLGGLVAEFKEGTRWPGHSLLNKLYKSAKPRRPEGPPLHSLHAREQPTFADEGKRP